MIVVLAALIGLVIATATHFFEVGTKQLPLGTHTLLIGLMGFMYSSVILAGFLVEFKNTLGGRKYFVALVKSLAFGLFITTFAMLGSAMLHKIENKPFKVYWFGVIFIFLLFSAMPLNGAWKPKHVEAKNNQNTPH